jgi:hypothetical protein
VKLARFLMLLAAGLAPSCGHRRPGADGLAAAEARAAHYQDSSGLLVGTYGVWALQPLPGPFRAEARALADYVRLDPGRGFDPADPEANRSAPDAVTSASATAGGGQVSSEWRFEGQLGLDVEGQLGGGPASAGVIARVSTEPDYKSWSTAVRGAVELFERNTALGLLLGYGRDRVEPVEVFGGQEAAWPAGHDRWAASTSLTQVLSPRWLLRAGLGATWQRGTLTSPYRRALVRPTLLLPEALPRARDRYTGFVGASFSISPALALHLSQGGYLDSWSVAAVIPEVTLAAEVHPGIVVSGGYRFYAQSEAEFYQATYAEPQPVMTGDLRLGQIRDHTLSLELVRQFRAGERIALPVVAGYQLSVLDYKAVGSRVMAHVFSLGLGVEH